VCYEMVYSMTTETKRRLRQELEEELPMGKAMPKPKSPFEDWCAPQKRIHVL